jgi:hypothetical protein
VKKVEIIIQEFHWEWSLGSVMMIEKFRSTGVA